MATTMKAGGIVTSAAGEGEFVPNRPGVNNVCECLIEWKSGSMQFGVSTQGDSNVITSGNDTLSASGDKIVMTLIYGVTSLYAKGSGTFRVSW